MENPGWFTGMPIIVLPDDDYRVKDLEPGHIGTDGNKFYCPKSLWPELRTKLKQDAVDSSEAVDN